ncbi:MAG: tetratricopeptide repeat protein [Acidobacteria bacterium]|nr:MAG: tetratricopeptide repeat protein [Acidobacteriota bacterium]
MGQPRAARRHEELIRRAQDALDAEQFGEAEALGRRALMLRPESSRARQVLASALIEQGEFEEAARLLEQNLEAEPDDVPALADLGLCYFEMCRFGEAEAVLGRALALDPDDPQACYWMALCVERRGEYRAAEECFRRAHEIDPEAYPMPTRFGGGTFARALAEALAETRRHLPPDARRKADQLRFVVRDLPRESDLLDFDPPLDPCLYGLYVGVPLPERRGKAKPRRPDTIYIYKRNLERFCHDEETLIRELRLTLSYEIGHYLGYDEEELAQRGLA